MLDRIRNEKLNPSWWWNFAEEDLIGDAIDVGSSVRRLTVPERMLDRWFIGLALLLSGRGALPPGKPDWYDFE